MAGVRVADGAQSRDKKCFGTRNVTRFTYRKDAENALAECAARFRSGVLPGKHAEARSLHLTAALPCRKCQTGGWSMPDIPKRCGMIQQGAVKLDGKIINDTPRW